MKIKSKPFHYITYKSVPGGSKQHETVDTPTKELAEVELALRVFEKYVLTLGSEKAKKCAMSSVCNIEAIELIDG